MNGCDFEHKNLPLVTRWSGSGGVKLILTFPENLVQSFPLYLENKRMRKVQHMESFQGVKSVVHAAWSFL